MLWSTLFAAAVAPVCLSTPVEPMRIYDISVAITPEMHVYPGDPGASISPVVEIGERSHYALSRLVLGTHTGTHVDPPAHFFPNGITADQISLQALVGPATVVELLEGAAVTAAFLDEQGLPPRVERILFKTRNGALWEKPKFQRRFVYLEEGAARWLVARGAQLVGIDYLSAEQFGARQPVTHWALLGAGVVILEGLDLRAVSPGDYTLVCLPLKIKGGDGAPARAILIADSEEG